MAASAQVTDHEFGDEQDPLLVRPFVLQDSESPTADPSTQTWPSATTRETRSTHATDGDPTQIIVLPDPARRGYRRRVLVIAGVGAVVVLAAAAAAFAALRPGMSTSVSVGPAGSPLPAVTGPAPSAPTSAGTPPDSVAGATHSARHSGSASSTASAPVPASGSVGLIPATTSTNAAATTAPQTAQPHNLAPPAVRTGTIRGQNGLCLDLNGGVPVDDNHVQVFTCNGTSAQTWTLATDGTLRVAGMCALIVGDDTVHIVTCDGRTTAQWRVVNSTLVNAADGNCLTDPSGGRQSGTGVTVTTCGGSASQRWSLP